MRKVELQILASDVLENCYYDTDTCAITRALNRAGLPYQDWGFTIRDENHNAINVNREEKDELSRKVVGMYYTKDNKHPEHQFPIEDFTHVLTFIDLDDEKSSI